MLSFFLSMMGICLTGFWYGESIIMMFILVISLMACSFDYHVSKMSTLIECDMISDIMVYLSVWVSVLAMMAGVKMKILGESFKVYMFWMSLLVVFLVMSFVVSSYMGFYISFEASLVPIFLMVLGWGYQPERLQAGVYMLFYTLAASLPLLMWFFFLKKEFGSLYMYMQMGGLVNSAYSIFLLMAFLVKYPMFMLHLWLPKAHVEAPVSGSMVLAGVMLKLGGYGILRVLWLIWPMKVIAEALVSVSIWGGIVMSGVCLRQLDMKSLIAYSSVVHMSGCICGLVSMNEWGVKGCILIMIGHGVCSSGLFFLVNMVYERTHSRSLLINKGLLSYMPSLSLWWFLLLAGNMAAPPSISLLGEVGVFIGLVSWSMISLIGLVTMSLVSAGYSLYLYNCSQHGLAFSGKKSYMSGTLLEYLILFSHWAPLNFLILKSSWVI